MLAVGHYEIQQAVNFDLGWTLIQLEKEIAIKHRSS